jgi:simple sugar transport system ATP-binding protein
MNNDPLLSVEYLTKSFRTGHTTVSCCTILTSIFSRLLDERAGDFGLRKTTLLNLIAAIEIPDKGEVRWQGRSVRLMTDSDLHRERARLSIYFQH